MIDFERKPNYDFSDLLQIMRILRSPGGCVWDQEQTHASIRRDFLEETYEACGAIDEGSPEHLCEELGDVLLQVVFHADIAQEEGSFSISDVCDGICKKLIFRHPHVFGDVVVNSSAEVLANWDVLKQQEKQQLTQTDVLRAVSDALPALWYAEKVSHKAQKNGLSFSRSRILEQIRRNIDRLTDDGDAGTVLGDLLFSTVCYAERMELDSEELLRSAVRRFIDRCAAAEEKGQFTAESAESVYSAE